jgi:hypothetical protein
LVERATNSSSIARQYVLLRIGYLFLSTYLTS